MRVVTKTGLVPVHTNSDKAVFGVPPAVAHKGVLAGSLHLVDIPDDVETHEIVFAVPVPESAPTASSDDGDDIPPDWESMHHAKIVALAKKLVGGDLPEVEGKRPAEVARELIAAEVEHRAAQTANQ